MQAVTVLSHLVVLFRTLPRRVRLRVVLLSFLVLGSSTLDGVGLGLLYVLFNLVLQDGQTDSDSWLFGLEQVCGDRASFLFGACAVVLVVFVAKATLHLFSNWLRLSFQWKSQEEVAGRLLRCYLGRPYLFHLSHHTATLTHRVTGMVARVVIAAFCSFIDLLGSALLFLAIGIVLLRVEPIAAGGLIGVVGLVWFVYWAVTSPVLTRLGVEINTASAAVYRIAQESLRGVKAIKAFGREIYFASEFEQRLVDLSIPERRQGILAVIPKHLFEGMVVLAFVASMGVVLVQSVPAYRLLPSFALFAAAGFRLMPAMVGMAVNSQNLRLAGDSIKVIHDDLLHLGSEQDGRVEEEPEPGRRTLVDGIDLRDLRFKYPGEEKAAVDGICIRIERGKTYAIVGKSGAGKTTLVDLMLGLLEPTSGEVLVDGQSLASLSPKCRSLLFGYVPQDTYLVDGTIGANIALGLSPDRVDVRALERSLATAALSEFVGDAPEGLESTVGEVGRRISGGQRQRIGIARGMYHDPPILIFDEATASLDSLTEEEIGRSIALLRGEKTIVMIAHRVSTFRQVDLIFHLEKGRLVDSGSFGELRQRDPGFRAMVDEMSLKEQVDSQGLQK